jgi:dynein light intermediate chain
VPCCLYFAYFGTQRDDIVLLSEELIREITCECPERGLVLLRVRDELRLSVEAYQTLYHNSIAYGRQKAVQAEAGVGELEKEVCRLEAERNALLARKKELAHKVMVSATCLPCFGD